MKRKMGGTTLYVVIVILINGEGTKGTYSSDSSSIFQRPFIGPAK